MLRHTIESHLKSPSINRIECSIEYINILSNYATAMMSSTFWKGPSSVAGASPRPSFPFSLRSPQRPKRRKETVRGGEGWEGL